MKQNNNPNKNLNKRPNFVQGPILYIVIAIILTLVLSRFVGTFNPDQIEKLAYSEVLDLIQKDKLSNVMITGNTLIGRKVDSKIPETDFGNRYDLTATIPNSDQFHADVKAIYSTKLNKPFDQVSVSDYKFKMESKEVEGPSWWVQLLPFLIPVGLMAVLWFFMLRQQGGSNKGVMSFGKSRARLNDPLKNKKTFADVAGAEEEKEDLREIVEFLKNPQRFLAVGARIPRGVLLVGPPGTGKTLLARATAGEAGVPFFTISGSDFVEMFVGVGASRVRDLFDQAKRQQPSIVFIDEIDAVGRQRGAGLGGGHDEREQTLNQLLVEMDGFAPNEGVIVMAATNRSDILDPALLRPGRFDRQITVGYPDVKGREEILKVHARGKPLGEDVDLSVLARRTPYFTGADLENVLNEAAILTARAHKEKITMTIIEEAINRVSIGPEKKSKKVTEKDKKLVAYHEAGHAVVAHFTPGCDPVHEVSIIPRGSAGGYTMSLPSEETSYTTRTELLADITMSMGGNCAEKLVFGDTTTGAVSDLQHASKMARSMVTKFGMSEAVGPMFLGGDHEVFLGRGFSQADTYSEEINSKVDREVQRILETCYHQAEQTINQYIEKLHLLADVLLEKEKVDGEEFKALMEEGLKDERLNDQLADAVEPESSPGNVLQ